MRSVALGGVPSDFVSRLRAALPGAELLHLSLEQIERRTVARRLSAAVFGEEPLRGRGAAQVAVLTLRNPELATVALLSPGPSLPQYALSLGHARVDQLVIAGTEDHPNRLREVFAQAAVVSVARTVEQACCSRVPALAAANVMPALEQVRMLRTARDLASALGMRLASLRDELAVVPALTPRRLLAGLRLMLAGRLLGDTTESVHRIGAAVGYGSRRAFEKACHDLLRASPREVRDGGGLWFASRRFHEAVRYPSAA